MIDFKALMALTSEYGGDDPIRCTIEYLAMCDVPMSDAVIQLGIACNILLPGYHNGWSEELDGL